MHGATVNGSWLTEAHVFAITSAGPLQLSYFAWKISADSLIGWSNGTCGGRPFKLIGWAVTPRRDGPRNRQLCGEALLQSDYSSVKIALPEWNSTIAPRAVPDWFHRRSDWISGPKAAAASRATTSRANTPCRAFSGSPAGPSRRAIFPPRPGEEPARGTARNRRPVL